LNVDTVNNLLDISSPRELVIKISEKLPRKYRQAFLECVPKTQLHLSNNARNVDNIKFMTMHASKGKEADLVVLVNAASWYEIESTVDQDEEERVHFVAATRTRKDLIIADMDDIYYEPTQFLPDPNSIGSLLESTTPSSTNHSD